MKIIDLEFNCVSRERFREYRKASLPNAAAAPLYAGGQGQLEAFRRALTMHFDPFADAIFEAAENLAAGARIEAFLSWCNCPSLNKAAKKLNAPVIYNEVGPLRGPNYVGTYYFDFSGVNGNSTPPHEWTQAKLQDAFRDEKLWSKARLRGALVKNIAADAKTNSPKYPVGLALQVEDNSNMIAYGNGESPLSLAYRALDARAPDSILIRSHPAAHFSYRHGLGVADSSANSIEFLHKIERLLTINSSLAVEAALWEVPFTAYGELSAAFFSSDHPAAADVAKHSALWANAYFIGYLLPKDLLFDIEYYRWRLSGPTLAECYRRHRAYLNQNAESLDQSERRVSAQQEESRCHHRNKPIWTSTLAIGPQLDALKIEYRALLDEYSALLAAKREHERVIESYKIQSATYEGLIAHADGVTKDLQKQISDYAKQATLNAAQISQLETERKREVEGCIQQAERYKEQVAKAEAAIGDLRKQISDYAKQATLNAAQIGQLETERKREVDGYIQQAERYKEQIAKAEAAIGDLRKQISDYAKQATLNAAQIGQLETERKREVDGYIQQAERYKEQVAKAEAAIGDLRKQISDYAKQATLNAAQINQLETERKREVDGYIQQAERYKEQVAKAEAAIGDLRKQIFDYAAQATLNAAQINQLETERKREVDGYIRQAERYKEQVAKAEAAIGDLRKQISDYAKQATLNAAQINQLETERKREVDGYIQQAERYKEQVAKAEAAIGDLRKQISDYAAQATLNAAQINQLETERKREVDGYIQQAERYKEQVAKAEAAIGDLRKQISDYAAQATLNAAQISQLETEQKREVDGYIRQAERYKEQIEEAQSLISALQEQIGAYHEQSQRYAEQITTAQNVIAQLQDKNAGATRR